MTLPKCFTGLKFVSRQNCFTTHENLSDYAHPCTSTSAHTAVLLPYLETPCTNRCTMYPHTWETLKRFTSLGWKGCQVNNIDHEKSYLPKPEPKGANFSFFWWKLTSILISDPSRKAWGRTWHYRKSLCPYLTRFSIASLSSLRD